MNVGVPRLGGHAPPSPRPRHDAAAPSTWRLDRPRRRRERHQEGAMKATAHRRLVRDMTPQHRPRGLSPNCEPQLTITTGPRRYRRRFRPERRERHRHHRPPGLHAASHGVAHAPARHRWPGLRAPRVARPHRRRELDAADAVVRRAGRCTTSACSGCAFPSRGGSNTGCDDAAEAHPGVTVDRNPTSRLVLLSELPPIGSPKGLRGRHHRCDEMRRGPNAQGVRVTQRPLPPS